MVKKTMVNLGAHTQSQDAFIINLHQDTTNLVIQFCKEESKAYPNWIPTSRDFDAVQRFIEWNKEMERYSRRYALTYWAKSHHHTVLEAIELCDLLERCKSPAQDTDIVPEAQSEYDELCQQVREIYDNSIIIIE